MRADDGSLEVHSAAQEGVFSSVLVDVGYLNLTAAGSEGVLQKVNVVLGCTTCIVVTCVLRCWSPQYTAA